MGLVINNKLLDCDGEAEITENFNRIIETISDLETNSGADVTNKVKVVVENSLYMASFDSALGSAVASQILKYGDVVSKPSDPTLATKTFVAWTVDGVEYDFATPIINHVELVATWEDEA